MPKATIHWRSVSKTRDIPNKVCIALSTQFKLYISNRFDSSSAESIQEYVKTIFKYHVSSKDQSRHFSSATCIISKIAPTIVTVIY